MDDFKLKSKGNPDLKEQINSLVMARRTKRQPLVGVNYRFPLDIKNKLDLASHHTGLDRTELQVVCLEMHLDEILATKWK